MPPFEPTHTPLQLIDIVRAVSLCVDPEGPEAVPQAAWDAGRTDAGHPDAPQALVIARRLGTSWRTVLQIAHGDPNDALRALGSAAADKGRKGVTLRRAATAMKQAALRLGKPGINRTDYERGRQLIVDASGRGPSREIAERALPTLTQIETVLRQNEMSWEDGLTLAGLEPPDRHDNSGIDPDAAVRAFVEDLGALPPNAKQLRAWTRARGVAATVPRSQPIKEAIARLQAERAAAGQPPLETAPDRAWESSPPSKPVSGPKTARSREWTRAEIITGLARAVRLLPAGEQLSQRTLKEVAAGHPDAGIPSWSPVDRCRRRHYPDETWDQWRREAEQLARTPGEI